MFFFYFEEDEITVDELKIKLKEIEAKGFIPIPEGMKKRKDDGFVGQVIERELGIPENNRDSADLGNIELKGKRCTLVEKKGKKIIKVKGKLTLFHKNTDFGMTDAEIFEKFRYVKPSHRTGELKEKLFTTCSSRKNNLGLSIQYNKTEERIELLHEGKVISGWGEAVKKGFNKISNLLLVYAETEGALNSKKEKFHYIKAVLYKNCISVEDAIAKGHIVIEFCIDGELDSTIAPHDRGPHFRVRSLSRLEKMYESSEVIFDITKDSI